MGILISLTEFKKTLPKKRLKVSKSQCGLSTSDLRKMFTTLTDELLIQWNMYAKQQQLNALISNKLKISQKDFISDLNVLSSLEHNSYTPYVIFYPGAMISNPDHWVLGFHFEDVPYTTPEMPSECHARAFALVIRSMFQEAINKNVVHG